jgi:hypothetical protein
VVYKNEEIYELPSEHMAKAAKICGNIFWIANKKNIFTFHNFTTTTTTTKQPAIYYQYTKISCMIP